MNKELYREYVQECLDHPDFPDCREVNKGWEIKVTKHNSFLGLPISSEKWTNIPCDIQVPFYINAYLRRKKKTVNINGVEVVEPIRDRLPEIEQVYWFLYRNFDVDTTNSMYGESGDDKVFLKYGWHENKEDAELYWNAVLKPYLASYPS